MANPMRAHEFACKIGADTMEALVGELHSLARQLERGELSCGCMGGSDAGSIYAYRHDPAMTHDQYFELIDARITELEAAKVSTPADSELSRA